MTHATPPLAPHPRLGNAALYGADLHRTGLSWTRTALDLGLVSLILLRVAAIRDVFVVVNLCLVLIVVAAGLAVVARGRTHRCLAYGEASDARLPLAIVVLALAINAVGMLMVFLVR